MQHFHVQFPGFGWEFDITNVAFTIGNYPVYWYGLIITGAITSMHPSSSTVCWSV